MDLEGIVEQRHTRVLIVHQPWAWMLWPSSVPLVPDTFDDDCNVHPTDKAVKIDWNRVFHAVLSAVKQCLADPKACRGEPLEVGIEIPLSEAEYVLAQSWVGDEPVTYCYEKDILLDGRRRLMLASDHQKDHGMPVRSETFSGVGAALRKEEGPQAALEIVSEAAEWWDRHPDDRFWSRAGAHGRMLAQAYCRLSEPFPITPKWFDRLREWDNGIDVLAGLHNAGRTDSRLLTAVLSLVWRNKQARTQINPVLVIDMFRTMGFCINGTPSRRPRGKLTLFRGATEANRNGPSWTANLAIAWHFARYRQEHNRKGRVWKVTVPANRVLAYIDHEEEFIVDLAGMEYLIEEAGTGTENDRRTRRLVQRIQKKHPGGIKYDING